MPKIRAIHPSFWSDTTLAECSMCARLFYIGLWNFADDAGVFEWHERLLQSQVFPLDSGIDVTDLLAELTKHGRIGKFTHNNRSYGLILNFEKYQKPDSRYLRFTIGDSSKVKSIYHGVAPQGSRGEPSTDSDGDGEGVINNNGGQKKLTSLDDDLNRAILKHFADLGIKSPAGYLRKIQVETKYNAEAIKKAWGEWKRGGVSTIGEFYARCLHHAGVPKSVDKRTNPEHPRQA